MNNRQFSLRATMLAKKVVVVILLSTVSSVCAPAGDGDAVYQSGSAFAREIQGQGEHILKDFNPGSEVPGYSSAPPQRQYYSGVTAGGDGGLMNDGITHWSGSELGKAVNDSVLNNPGEPIAHNAPFILPGKAMQDKAGSLFGNNGAQCLAHEISHSEYTNHICERDMNTQQYCSRTAMVSGHWEETTEVKQMVIESSAIAFATNEDVYSGIFRSHLTGRVLSARVVYSWNKHLAFGNWAWFMIASTPYGQIDMENEQGSLALRGGQLITDGQLLSFSIKNRYGMPATDPQWRSPNMRYRFTVTLTVQAKVKIWIPEVKWQEHCPFIKSQGMLVKTECIEPGGEKTTATDGEPYSVYLPCWSYKDTYAIPASDPGSCKTWINHPACTLAARKCIFTSEDGVCLREYATYTCEAQRSGEILICGGDMFCLKGECENRQHSPNDDFKPVVSALAAVSAAGKDLAELHNPDIKAFSGQARFCTKFAVGFSDCCKDSGWGSDIGLANCSSEEKALGKAKENKLTVSVGEFCSKSVLGACVEKKRSYCQFDSRLAQIVQQQGRAWQLGIGFGDADSPDCKGITIEQLQEIKYNNLDFSNFYDDLMNGEKIPVNDAIIDRIKEQLNSQIKN